MPGSARARIPSRNRVHREPLGGYSVAAVEPNVGIAHEWQALSWRHALDLAQRARCEFPHRLIFFSDGTHVWRLDELT